MYVRIFCLVFFSLNLSKNIKNVSVTFKNITLKKSCVFFNYPQPNLIELNVIRYTVYFKLLKWTLSVYNAEKIINRKQIIF